MKSILFVEEEANVLDGLRRMLHSYRDEWQMEFLQSGKAAFERLAESPVDVLVTDVHVGGDNGESLLAAASEQFPSTVRIALSADVDRESWLTAAGTAHQYVAMPCEAEALKQIISRASAVRERVGDPAIKTVVGKVQALPALPSAYEELLHELQSAEPSVDRVGEIIAQDVGMAAKVLQLVKSSYFGLDQQVTDTRHAVALLGLQLVGSLVLAAGVFDQFDNAASKRFRLGELMDESMAIAKAAQQIAKQCCQQPQVIEDCVLVGMLQDIGKLVLASYFPEQLSEAIALAESAGISIDEAEQKVLGVSHADIGGYLLDLWGFPSVIVEGVTFHHTPSKSGGSTFTTLTAVHLANAILGSQDSERAAGIMAAVDHAYLGRLYVSEHLRTWQQALETEEA